jgi:hypothetical protein
MENKEEKKYTNIEKLKIIDRSKYIKIVKKKEDLEPDDVYIPIKKDGKTVYIVAQEH